MKWLYIGGIIIFEVGSALCGAAPNMIALIIGRVIAGVGGTGIYLGGLNCFSALTSREERSVYLAGISFFWGVGSVLGPVVGGLFSDNPPTWRWAFYINLVIAAVTAPIYLLCLPRIHPMKGQTIRRRRSDLDYVGFMLSATIWVFFALAFVSAGGAWEWSDRRTIGMLAAFGVSLVLYVLQQAFCLFTTPESRSFPVQLLKSRTQILLAICTGSTVTSVFVTTFYIPHYFIFVQNDTALMAAVRLLPFISFVCAVVVVSGWALAKVRYYAATYLVGGVIVLIGSVVFYVYLKPSTSTSTIYGISVLTGIGAGLTIQNGYAIAPLKVKTEDIINVMSLQNLSQLGGIICCLVIAGQIFQAFAYRNLSGVLAGEGFTAAEIREAVAGARSVLFQQLTGETRDAAITAITGVMQTSFIVVIAGACLQIICSLLMKWEKVFGEIVAVG